MVYSRFVKVREVRTHEDVAALVEGELVNLVDFGSQSPIYKVDPMTRQIKEPKEFMTFRFHRMENGEASFSPE